MRWVGGWVDWGEGIVGMEAGEQDQKLPVLSKTTKQVYLYMQEEKCKWKTIFVRRLMCDDVRILVILLKH